MSSVKISDYVDRETVLRRTHSMLEDGNKYVSAVEVASQLFPQLVEYVGAVLLEERKFRISDSQPEILILGTFFQED
jgi:hypothetical protein